MQRVHDSLAGVDLNLLVVLDALLAERHVTRAARRVGLTQPAASHALGRLRALLGDPLLVRGARGALVPTPRAAAIAPALRRALDGVSEALRGEPVFEPATARRSFRIGAGDYQELVLLPGLMEQLAREAPGIDLWVVQLPDDSAHAMAAGDVDLVLGVWRHAEWPAGIFQKPLFDEDFRCVVRAGHAATAQRLTLPRYCELSHLVVAPRGTPGSYVDEALARLGRSRRIAVRVPHFLIAPHVIAGSELIATLPTRIVRHHLEPLGLAMLPTPLDIPRFTVSMAWHERAHHDPGQRWLRDRIAELGKQRG